MPEQNMFSQFLPLIIIFGIFYFLIIRPQQKKQKELQQMVANLQKHDEVVTNSGIHGVVVIIKDNTVVLRVDDSTRIEFDKDVIATVTKKVEVTK